MKIITDKEFEILKIVLSNIRKNNYFCELHTIHDIYNCKFFYGETGMCKLFNEFLRTTENNKNFFRCEKCKELVQ